MANRHKGEVRAGRYILSVTFGALAQFEDASGLGILELMQAIDAGNAHVRDVRTLYWCALLAHQPEISRTRAMLVIVRHGFEPLVAALKAAIPAPDTATENVADDDQANFSDEKEETQSFELGAMRKLFLDAGAGTEDEFWSITPRQYIGRMNAARKRFETEDKLLTKQAWHTALFTRTGKFPTLTQALGERPKPLTAEQLEVKLNAASSGMKSKTWAEWRKEAEQWHST